MIYLDNAATSCPKPPEVIEAVAVALREGCANASRGAYGPSLEASRTLFRTRRALADLFNVKDESRVAFTLNATYALNMALKGLLKPKTAPHVVTSSIEHNSVARPLQTLAGEGVEITKVPCASDGTTDPDDILAAIRADTALVVLTHASNVLGTVLPILEIGPELRERGVPLLLDAAQTAGVFPIDVEAMGVSLLAVSGHKGLLGPQGVGALYVAPDRSLDTIIEGGTGSQSDSIGQPVVCPDRFESGTQNGPGLAGFGAALALLARSGGVAARGAREHALARRLRSRLQEIDGVRLYGPLSQGLADMTPWGPPVAPIVSVAVEGLASSEVARILDREFDIAVRAGLHCAPDAHRVAGTLSTGLVRLSIGHTTTDTEIELVCDALADISSRPASYWLTEWEMEHAR